MANVANVRFYKLEALPSFNVNKHKGIFVHVTKTMHNTPWDISDKEKPIRINPKELLITTPDIFLDKWLEKRRIESIASGLWFGGENGWELLSNETTDAAINAAIDAKIQGLDAGPYAQATINTNTDSSTLTIKGIKEANGIIGIPVDTENRDLNIAIDGVYTESNKIATQSTVTNAIGTLDANTVQAVTFASAGGENPDNTVLTFKGIKETNGKIAQGDEQNPDTFIVGDAKLKIQIGSTEAGAFEVFSANAKENGAIKLDEYVFRKGDNNVISVITENPVSSTNPLVTKDDINGLVGAMHYRGGVTSLPTANENTKKGDVWIVTTAFDGYEVGDMFIARADGANATFDTVQGNLTLGTGAGKVAANTESLTENNIVVATSTGIKTIGISVDNLTDTTTNNKRDLTIGNGVADGDFHHDVTITDDFTVIGKPFTKTINISSTNRSIEIAQNGTTTGVRVDLVWNTTIE